MHQLSSTPTLQHVVNECSVSTTKACPGLVSRVEVNPMTGISSRTLEWHAARLTGPGSETREGVPVLQMPEKAAGFMMDSPSSTIQVTEHSTGEETATDAVFFHSLSILDVELVGLDVQVNDQEFVVSDPRELNISQSGRQPVSGEESPQWRHTVTLPGASVLKLIPWSRFPCGPRRGGRPVLTWRLRYRYNTCDGHQHLYLAWPFSHQLDWSHKRCCRLRAPRTTIDAVGTSFVDAAVRVPQGQLVVWTSLNPGHNVVQARALLHAHGPLHDMRMYYYFAYCMCLEALCSLKGLSLRSGCNQEVTLCVVWRADCRPRNHPQPMLRPTRGVPELVLR